MRRGGFSRSSASSTSFAIAAADGVRLEIAAGTKAGAFRWTRSIISRLAPRCGVRISTFRPRRSESQLLQQIAVLEIGRNMNLDRNEWRIHVVLLQDGSEELAGIEGLLVLPEQFALIDHPAAAHVKDRNGDHVVFLVVAEDVDVVIAHDGHLLPLGERLHRFDRVAIVGGDFILFVRLKPLPS